MSSPDPHGLREFANADPLRLREKKAALEQPDQNSDWINRPNPAVRTAFTDPKVAIYKDINPLGDVLVWASDRKKYVEGEPYPHENIPKAAAAAGIYLNPLTGIPIILGQILHDPNEAIAAIPHMLKAGFAGAYPSLMQGFTGMPHHPAVEQKMKDESKRLWAEEPDSIIFGWLMASGIVKGIKSGIYRVKGAATEAVKAYEGGADVTVTPEIELQSLAQKMMRGEKELTPREAKVAEVLTDAAEAHLNAIRDEAILRKDPIPTEATKTTARDPLGLTTSEYIGLNKDRIAELFHYSDWGELTPAERITNIRVLSEALAEGWDMKADGLAKEIIKHPRVLEPKEHIGMVARAASIKSEMDSLLKTIEDLTNKGNTEAARRARNTMDRLDTDLEILVRASDLGGSEAGRALQIRKVLLKMEDYSIGYLKTKAKATKGKDLTLREKELLERFSKEESILREELKELQNKHEELLIEQERLMAEKVAATEVSRAKHKGKREAVLAERAMLLKELSDMGMRVNDITGVAPEALYKIGRVAITYLKEGKVSLDAAVAKTIEHLPSLTEGDIYIAMNTKNPKRIKQVRSELEKYQREQIREGQILGKIENLKRGIVEENPAKAPEPQRMLDLKKELGDLRRVMYKSGLDGRRVEKLNQIINELQDQISKGYEKAAKKQPLETEEIVALQEKIKELRFERNLDATLKDLDYQLETGNYKITAPKQKKQLPPDLARKTIELNRKRQEIRNAINDLAPMTPSKVFGEAVNVLRTLKATADMSALLRQGLIQSVSHPIWASKAFVQAFKSFFSKYTAEQIDLALRSADHHYIREQSGLYLAPVEQGVKLSLREEMYQSGWLKKVPGVKHIVEASERNMTTFLNLMRTAAFDDFLIKFPNATPRELQAWADWVNVTTGRGNLGAAAGAANGLSLIVFAPRFAMSRVQVPYLAVKYSRMPRVRRMIARDVAATTGVGMTALALGVAAGFEVGIDPREADFGKIIVGNTRIDIWGGMQQPIRLAMRIAMMGTDYAELTGGWLRKSELGSPVDLVLRYASFKAAPSVSLGSEVMTGKAYVTEEERTPLQTIAHTLVPMWIEDTADAYKDAGWGRAVMVGGATFMGIGVNTYADSETKVRRAIRKDIWNRDFSSAEQRRASFEYANPDKTISDKWYNSLPTK